MGVPFHFVKAKGEGNNPMPLLLHQGWPGLSGVFAK